VQGRGIQSTDPDLFGVVNTHFHLDLDPDNMLANLQKVARVCSQTQQVLLSAETIFQEGPVIQLGDKPSVYADAPMGGINFPGTNKFAITFRPEYPNCGRNCRAAMILHECAHFVGGVREINHFAMEFPVFDGKADGGGNHNYAELEPDEALRTASSYAAFAIHAATGIDSRFGARDTNL